MERKIYYLYLIRDLLNEKVYIGQTVRPKERWSQHKAYAKNNPVQYIHRAIAKYGIDNFQFEIIASCISQEDADWIEIELIKQYDSQNKDKGYNVASGGDHAWNTGLPTEQQPMYGKKQSEYFRQRMFEIHSKLVMPPHTDEWKKQASIWLTNRPVSYETKRKLSKSNTGKIRSQKIRDDMSKARAGKKSNHAKFSDTVVDQIRQEYKMPGITQQFLAKKYGATRATIGKLLRHETYK